jgi:hypothetical protein
VLPASRPDRRAGDAEGFDLGVSLVVQARGSGPGIPGGNRGAVVLGGRLQVPLDVWLPGAAQDAARAMSLSDREGSSSRAGSARSSARRGVDVIQARPSNVVDFDLHDMGCAISKAPDHIAARIIISG